MQAPPLLVERHAEYICGFAESTASLEALASEHFRLSGMYWGLTALRLVGRLGAMDRERLVAWVLACQGPDGGFGGSPRQDSHLLHTVSAVQVLQLYGSLPLLDAGRVAAYVAGLQQADGSFVGDAWGEVDTRFSYCALLCCQLLGQLAALDVGAAAQYVLSCQNFDGAFGRTPGDESHAGQVFCCVAALAIADALPRLPKADVLCWWLSERQCASGGLNGRPEKVEDVCYSWWCLSALAILGRLDWIDQAALTGFILSCQDGERGGISDRPEDMADVYHTFFGIAGLALMGHPGLEVLDPVLALPCSTVHRDRAAPAVP